MQQARPIKSDPAVRMRTGAMHSTQLLIHTSSFVNSREAGVLPHQRSRRGRHDQLVKIDAMCNLPGRRGRSCCAGLRDRVGAHGAVSYVGVLTGEQSFSAHTRRTAVDYNRVSPAKTRAESEWPTRYGAKWKQGPWLHVRFNGEDGGVGLWHACTDGCVVEQVTF